MKAVVYDRYRSPDVLRLTEVEKPTPTEDQALIKIHAVSINGSDREGFVGKPFCSVMRAVNRPNNLILGSDIAGRVESVGKAHTEFKPGDEVFGEIGGYHGGFAEYACTRAKTLALKPKGMSFEEAAAIPQGGSIALNGIVKKGQVRSEHQVLINGAGGSAGSFAIQLARLHGAEVTGVDHTEKLDFMRSLGANHVIDYTQQDFTKIGKRYDLILDLIARRSVLGCRHALNDMGTYFFVGGCVGVLIQLFLMAPFLRSATGGSMRLLLVPQSRADLISVTELCEASKIVPVIDRRYPLSDVPDAMKYVAEGRTKGKVVITVAEG